MIQLTNFAGPVCLFPSPTEQGGFVIVLVVAAILLAIGVINLKLYSITLHKWFNKSVSALWQRTLLICAGILTGVVAIGYFTGTSQKGGYCMDGIWEGLQIQLMWIALATTILIAALALILGALLLIRLAMAALKKLQQS